MVVVVWWWWWWWDGGGHFGGPWWWFVVVTLVVRGETQHGNKAECNAEMKPKSRGRPHNTKIETQRRNESETTRKHTPERGNGTKQHASYLPASPAGPMGRESTANKTEMGESTKNGKDRHCLDDLEKLMFGLNLVSLGLDTKV